MIEYADYLEMLKNWAQASRKYIYTPKDRKDLSCYGTGYDNWGVQTNQKALAAFGILGAETGNEEIIDCALRMLRFSLESHIEGSYHCTEEKKWGHTWISALGIERMMHAVEALEIHMTDNDKALLKKVLQSECDWLMDNHEVIADINGSIGKNKPESNLWNGAILHRTAMMYPELKRAEKYREKGSRFLVNSISHPSDIENNEILDGKKILEWFVGPNFTESYALNHHGYMNVGYMVICLSNTAMLHFSFKKRNIKAPESLYHHAYDLWKLIKLCTFPDGRLLRIGGDTRVRYCYCQDYAIPMWNFIQDKYGETDCEEYEKQWMQTLKRELKENEDGSFLGERAKTLEICSPLYYTRLEADRAAAVSMAAHWRKFFNNFTDAPQNKEQAENLGSWHDDFHGSCFVKSEKRAVSWTWISAERPQGLCLPTNRSDMAEWKQNLSTHIKGTGLQNAADIISHSESTFENGFATIGKTRMKSITQLGEGQPEDITAIQDIAFAALPDNATAICFQYAKTPYRVYTKEIKALSLQMPNDMFNDSKRTYFVAKDKTLELEGIPGKEKLIDLNSDWVNVDNALGVHVFHGGNISINRPATRQIGIKFKEAAGGMLYADEICAQVSKELQSHEKGDIIADIGFAIRICNAEKTQEMTQGNEVVNDRDFRSVKIPGEDGKTYIFAANFGEDECEATYPMETPGQAKELTSAKEASFEKELKIQCAPGSCKLLQINFK